MQYTLDRYRSTCSAIKCLLEITADDYFVTSNGAVYDAILDNGLLTRFMPTKYHHLPASVWLPNCMFVHVSVCASVQLECHGLKI